MRVREARYPMICLETALPAKFEATIVEALGAPPPRPARFEGLEQLPQRVEKMAARADELKKFIGRHAR
jgi:threonine synthase